MTAIAAATALAGCAPTPAADTAVEAWSLSFAQPVVVAATTPETAIVYSSDAQTLSALRLADGATSWSMPLAPGPQSTDVRGDAVIFRQSTNAGWLIGAVALDSGEPVWSRTVTGGAFVGAWRDGRVLVADDRALQVTDRANAVRATWHAPEGCEPTRADLVDGDEPWVAVLLLCGEESSLTRLDDGLREQWTTPVAAGYSFKVHGGRVVTSTTGSDLVVLNGSGETEWTTAGFEISRTSLVHRRFEDDVIDLTQGGAAFTGVYPVVRQLGPFRATLVAVASASGEETPVWVQPGTQALLTQVADDVYLLTSQADGEGRLARIDLRSGGSGATAPLPSPAATPAAAPANVDTVAFGPLTLVQTVTTVAGGRRMENENAPLGRRYGTATLFTVATAALAEQIIRIDGGEDATFDEDRLVRSDDSTLEAARGTCVLAVALDDGVAPLGASSAADLAEAVFDADQTGACHR